ncbi:hypothetical protein ANANG_G00179120, partial [Anguilla anguilla]
GGAGGAEPRSRAPPRPSAAPPPARSTSSTPTTPTRRLPRSLSPAPPTSPPAAAAASASPGSPLPSPSQVPLPRRLTVSPRVLGSSARSPLQCSRHPLERLARSGSPAGRGRSAARCTAWRTATCGARPAAGRKPARGLWTEDRGGHSVP